MHSLANILSDNPSLQLTNELQEFIQVLSSIQDGLHLTWSANTTRVINNLKTPPPLAAQSLHGMKQKQSTILPSSIEI